MCLSCTHFRHSIAPEKYEKQNIFSGMILGLLPFTFAFFKMAILSLFSVFFKQTTQILQQISVKNVHRVSCASQLSHYESPPLSTRPCFRHYATT